jgi:hypothetical protein
MERKTEGVPLSPDAWSAALAIEVATMLRFTGAASVAETMPPDLDPSGGMFTAGITLADELFSFASGITLWLSVLSSVDRTIEGAAFSVGE